MEGAQLHHNLQANMRYASSYPTILEGRQARYGLFAPSFEHESVV